MAERHTTIFGDQIDITAMGLGLTKDVDDNLKVLVDDTTIEISEVSGSEGLQVKDSGISEAKLATNAVTETKIADDAVTEAKLDMFNAPTEGYYLKYTSNGLEWADVDADAVQDDDVICNEIPTGLINSSNVTYTLANTPVVGTVMVFLNGMLQAPGVGLDYTISGDTITFVKAPRTGSDLYVSYIIT